MDNRHRDSPQSDIVAIPSLTAAPVETLWIVTEAGNVADVDVTPDVFHDDPSQIVVELVSPQGTWTLRVQDVDGSGATIDGCIRPRTQHFTVEGAFDCTPQACTEPTPVAAPDLRLARAGSTPPFDLALSWSAVAGAGTTPAPAAFHVRAVNS